MGLSKSIDEAGMGSKTGISWTQSTWSPTGGCTKVSPACGHCYAEALSHRYGWTTLPWTAANEAANVSVLPGRLEIPARWREPRLIFVDSISDLFHRAVPDDFIAAVFAVMTRTPRHTYQVLTKRPERMHDLLNDAGFWKMVGELATAGLAQKTSHSEREALSTTNIFAASVHLLPNVYLGTSIENNRFAARADALRDTPAARRFVSAEPLLASINRLDLSWIDQLIVGGESGSGARVMQSAWVDEAKNLTDAAGAAFFFKQLGVVLAHDLGLKGKGIDPTQWSATWSRHEQPSRPSACESCAREALRLGGDGRSIPERIALFRSIGNFSDELRPAAAGFATGAA
jgi:protein gp37